MTDINKLSYEEAFKMLQSIVEQLEKPMGSKDSLSLEDAIKQYTQGEDLYKRCEALLKSAESKIEEIQDSSKEG